MATPARTSKKDGHFKDWFIQNKGLTLLALPILIGTSFLGFYFVWGALFIFWALSSTMSGQAFLVEAIDRATNPVLFWIISIMWLGFGVLYILADIYPDY